MESINRLFLQALRASLQQKSVDWEVELTPEEWGALFSLAETHHVLPMVYEAVIDSPAGRSTDKAVFAAVKNKVRYSVALQMMKTNAFFRLLQMLVSAGAAPVVVKGIVCRELYPNPDYRISADEDVLIPEEQFTLCHETLQKFGMELADPSQNFANYEISYHQTGGPLHIELHKSLFPPESDIFGALNRYFEDVHERTVSQNIQGISVPTLNPTDHLFFLICHGFKHFLYCGFGIRQVCDICLYANAFGDQINWEKIVSQCEEIRADRFAAALFRIGEKYLTFQPEKACYPSGWRELAGDETPLLEDLLASGVFGKSSMSRKYSSFMTLNSVSDNRQGKKSGNAALKTIFPSVKVLSGRYPYLRDKPYLLPVAWTARIIQYRKNPVLRNPANNAAESIKIGTQRIELLQKYGIIDR